MNERIKLLAEQAGIQMFEDRAFGWSVIAGTDHNVQRFAELIVAECIEACEKKNMLDLDAWQRSDQIRKHFEIDNENMDHK